MSKKDEFIPDLFRYLIWIASVVLHPQLKISKFYLPYEVWKAIAKQYSYSEDRIRIRAKQYSFSDG